MKNRQIAALKYVIFANPSIGHTAKQVIATLLDNSKRLTRSVSINLVARLQGYDRKELKELYCDLSRAVSSAGSLHVNELIAATGAKARLTYSEGDMDCRSAIYVGKQKPTKLKVARSTLSAIDIARPGLYPSLEPHGENTRKRAA